MVYVMMGVCGSGKTAVGKALAAKLGLPFFDGDQFHSPANVAKMRTGIPLTDTDREPWLRAMAAKFSEWNQHGGAVLGCSALKKKYRDLLREGGETTFIFLDGPKELIAARLAARKGHFMPPALLDSQLAALEPPQNSIRVCIEGGVEEIVCDILRALKERKP